MSDELKRQAAEAAAAAELRPGMRLGLGTGSTAKFFVDCVGRRCRAGERFLAVPTSEATRRQAEGLGIPLCDLDEVEALDLTVDGADECNADLALIKGGGGALLREKMVAYKSKRMVVIADSSKFVDVLGAFTLPIEIVPFAFGSTMAAIARKSAALGMPLHPRRRLAADGSPYLTDNGNFIVDCANAGLSDPRRLAEGLSRLPGLVEHGLFIDLCAAIYLARPDGVAVLGARL